MLRVWRRLVDVQILYVVYYKVEYNGRLSHFSDILQYHKSTTELRFAPRPSVLGPACMLFQYRYSWLKTVKCSVKYNSQCDLSLQILSFTEAVRVNRRLVWVVLNEAHTNVGEFVFESCYLCAQIVQLVVNVRPRRRRIPRLFYRFVHFRQHA